MTVFQILPTFLRGAISSYLSRPIALGLSLFAIAVCPIRRLIRTRYHAWLA